MNLVHSTLNPYQRNITFHGNMTVLSISTSILIALMMMGVSDGDLKTDRQCAPNESYNTCSSACEPSCKNPHPEVCAQYCVPRCQCNPGFFRNDDGICLNDCSTS